MFRKLRANEIECRVGSCTASGFTLLLYKDARCDMAILDETVGAMNWQRSHSRDNANCTVSIWDAEKGIWISKEDTGTESFTEKEKGLASDSFKRSCFNWGIGRELYTAPFIWISGHTVKDGNRYKTDGYERGMSVASISYNDAGEICELVINDKSGACAYAFKNRNAKKETNKRKSETSLSITEKLEKVKALATARGTDIGKVLDRAGVDRLEDIEEVKLDALLESWSK